MGGVLNDPANTELKNVELVSLEPDNYPVPENLKTLANLSRCRQRPPQRW